MLVALNFFKHKTHYTSILLIHSNKGCYMNVLLRLSTLVLFLLLLVGCSDERKIRGTWVGEYPSWGKNGNLSYKDQTLTLEKDGYFQFSRETVVKSGSWELLEGDSLKCTYDGKSNNYSYFLDGDELWIDAFLGYGDCHFYKE